MEDNPIPHLEVENKKNSIVQLMLQPDIILILGSSTCPIIREFKLQKPKNEQVNKQDTSQKPNLCVLPYDKYRDIDEFGIEGPPPDVYD